MSRWYRAYDGTVSDPKIGEAALIAETSRSVAVATWHALLESAAAAQDGGRFDTTPRRIAAMLGEPAATIERLASAFEEIGLVSDSFIVAWKRRQFDSDTSTERVREFRKRSRQPSKQIRNDDETFQQQDVTPPDTDTEKKDSEADASGADAPPTDAREACWQEGVPHLVAMGASDRDARSNIGRWLKGHPPIAVLGAIQRARDHGTRDPIPLVGRILNPIGANGHVSKAHSAAAVARRLADEARDDEARDDELSQARGVGAGRDPAGLLPAR